MKHTNILKVLRVVLAILFFVPLLLFFILPSNQLPVQLHILGHIQLLPAVLNGMFVWVAALLLISLFFGRIYCSVICPAGVLQDGINRLFCIGKKKKKGSRRFRYHRPYNRLRYVLLALTAGLAIFGFMGLCTWLDPYSNFGRIAGNLFRPAAIWVNNILAAGLNRMGNYALVYTSIRTVTTASAIAASVALVTFIVMVVFRGRLFCNTLCPVGALLSLISRYSFFRISFNEAKCTRCKACEQTCKAEAIRTENLSVDTSKCVNCFNCISSCKKDAIHYSKAESLELKIGLSQIISKGHRPVEKRHTIDQAESLEVISTGHRPVEKRHIIDQAESLEVISTGHRPVEKRHIIDQAESLKSKLLCTVTSDSRRTFLATSAAVAVSLPAALLNAQQYRRRRQQRHRNHMADFAPVTPPGSLSLAHFESKCTACHLCVTRCPSRVLRPAGLEYGFSHLLKPHMAFIDSFCNYTCTVCGEVCPTGAIQPVTEDEKKTIQTGIAHLYIDRCIVNTEETDCGACSEHCPTQAVHMIRYKGTLTIPQIEPDLCIGCGGCESICPVRPHRAIVVIANDVHLQAQKPAEEEKLDVKLDDFGF